MLKDHLHPPSLLISITIIIITIIALIAMLARFALRSGW